VLFLTQNAPQTIWWPDSVRTRWGAHSTPPDSLAGLRGWSLWEGEGFREGTGGKGREEGGEEGKGREGKGHGRREGKKAGEKGSGGKEMGKGGEEEGREW